MSNTSYYFILWILCIVPLIHSLTPKSPIQCNKTICTLENSYGTWNDRKTCYALNVTYPTTEQQLRLAVSHVVQNNLKAKIVTKFSHTIPTLSCPLQNNHAFFISTEKYDSGIEIDAENLAVTVDSGVKLRELIDEVEKNGFSLVNAPYWEGVTIGGVISTGAHGSSWWGKGGAFHEQVLEISVVVPASKSEGYAKILRLDSHHPLFNAAKVSLGVLGAISKVKLSLEHRFKRSITFNFTDDNDIENVYMDHANKYEFADITWYPSRHTAVYRYDFRAPLNASGDGVFDFIGFQANSILVPESVRGAEKLLENTGNSKGKCLTASASLAFKKLTANGLKNNGQIFTGYPVIGYQGKMQTSGSCLYSSRIDTSCAWDPRIKGLFFYESSAIFPASKFGDFIKDVKNLRDINPQNFCGIDNYNGILIRYIKASEAYLGPSEDSIVIDFNYYRANDQFTPRLNQDVWEELEQMAFFKYGAKPHWAKNRNLAFLNVRQKYPKFNAFIDAKNQMDPQNVFSGDWSDEILYGKELVKFDGCALEGMCICSEDRHCSPQKGYLCTHGLVYKEARVCRLLSTSVNTDSL
ncbi:L-gulonolactone oxidase 3 [Lathyrus oleraceus]|uniref:L-gulonolactone oxidase n=1 Tax=Pisum sativum TaxID=3888 RepID=A0A9D5A1T2_PEA|nr:L-gulonolactone oxidase 3-like [Pisum sativum]KAI5394222.1 L-gulonolactone oxidase 3 [Pisum sativum]